MVEMNGNDWNWLNMAAKSCKWLNIAKMAVNGGNG